jgi:hypothetical protein
LSLPAREVTTVASDTARATLIRAELPSNREGRPVQFPDRARCHRAASGVSYLLLRGGGRSGSSDGLPNLPTTVPVRHAPTRSVLRAPTSWRRQGPR